MTRKLVVLLIVLVLVVSGKPKLRFNRDGTFKILQMSDLHCGENVDQDFNTTEVIRTLVHAENPDFLAFSGDMVSGYAWDQSPNWYERIWKRWTAPLLELKKPYGYTLGNHDSEADLNRRQIVELDMKHPYSYTQLCPEEVPGASNYYIPVYSAKDENKVVMNIWFFDSQRWGCVGIEGFGCVPHEAVDWYLETSRRLEKEQGGKKPGVAFMHIPPQEWMYAWNHFDSVGNKSQLVKCQAVNTGLMGAFYERDEMVSIFTGHDHKNDYSVKFGKLTIGYTRKTGYGSYGPAEGKLRGGRIQVFTEEDFALQSTYIIQEDGSIDKQVPQEEKGVNQDYCDFLQPPHSIFEDEL